MRGSARCAAPSAIDAAYFHSNVSPALLRLKPGITAKLFLAVLATAVFVVIAMGLAAQWSFSRGFVGYLNELAVERLEAVRPRVIEAYLANGASWDFLRDEKGKWRKLLRPVAGVDAPLTPASVAATPPMSDLTGAMLRFALLDADARLVVGYADVRPNAPRLPLVVNGHTVGWLTTAPFETVSAAGDVRFAQSQLRASWTMGAVSVLLAALIALWAARALLRPVRQVAEATHRLAAGDYATRVDIASRDEVGQLARDFNRLAVALERNEQMRRDFMADISHELRTPLGVLNGELEALEDGVRPLTRQSLQSLQAEVATLNKLVSDLYDLSLADAGAMTHRPVPVDLAGVLQASVASFRARLAEAGIALELRLDARALVVAADARRLGQLFGNLLENAVRYTDAGGTLRVAARREGGAIVVEFCDSAPGVSPEHLPRLFDRFYRVEASRNRASGGAGLGLAISRRIVEAHRGEISAHASALGGLCIAMRFPLLSADATQQGGRA
ncbi:two-component sensor histidine kinase [Acidovorax carolinensis]|uniref:histidine kinase n=1 Tax=Acidovorax carolinensis TaxID=553814 RepID=A0A240U0A4_9BURK|nr:two-component sensor histidine kinase [Acidovorax carolinensis]